MDIKVDPLTIVCDLEVEGKRFVWIGAEALYRRIREKKWRKELERKT